MDTAQATSDPQIWRERDSELIAPAYSRYSDLVIDSAEGSHLYTTDGRDILDFSCGIAVTNLGHRHPAVTAAVHAQVDKLWHTSVTTFHPLMIEAAQALTSVTPGDLDQAFFCNSGAEAVEGSIKLARRATGRTEILAFYGAFHGRTYGALSLTASKSKYRRETGPYLPGIHHVRYPHCFRTCTHGSDEVCSIAEGEDIHRLFESLVPAEEVAAIIVEPIQGEGGYIVPPANFMPKLRQICDDYGILLIADEIQSGFGRTGKMFAVEHTGVIPDIMTVAKGFGNGLPIAAFVAPPSVMSALHKGEHGSTYGGNPVACAAAIAVIETIQKEKLLERAVTLGKVVTDRARGWKKTNPLLGDVRGLGLMIGLEFMEGGQSATGYTQKVQQRCVEKGLLLLTCGSEDNVIRLIPPLTISEEDLNAGLDILEQAMVDVRA